MGFSGIALLLGLGLVGQEEVGGAGVELHHLLGGVGVLHQRLLQLDVALVVPRQSVDHRHELGGDDGGEAGEEFLTGHALLLPNEVGRSGLAGLRGQGHGILELSVVVLTDEGGDRGQVGEERLFHALALHRSESGEELPDLAGQDGILGGVEILFRDGLALHGLGHVAQERIQIGDELAGELHLIDDGALPGEDVEPLIGLRLVVGLSDVVEGSDAKGTASEGQLCVGGDAIGLKHFHKTSYVDWLPQIGARADVEFLSCIVWQIMLMLHSMTFSFSLPYTLWNTLRPPSA